jgi:hypothetical protein
MEHTKMIYVIEIIEYEQMVIRYSGKWLIKTEYTKEQLDKTVKEMIKKQNNLTDSSIKEFGDEMEQRGYLKIIEDLTGIIQHTTEFEVG